MEAQVASQDEQTQWINDIVEKVTNSLPQDVFYSTQTVKTHIFFLQDKWRTLIRTYYDIYEELECQMIIDLAKFNQLQTIYG